MQKKSSQSSDNVRRPISSVQHELFTSIAPTASSQISGGHWHSYSTSFPSPPRHHGHGYGRVPSYSHQIAAQRLNQALFA